MNRSSEAESLLARSAVWRAVQRAADAFGTAARSSGLVRALRGVLSSFLRLDPGSRLRVTAVFLATFVVLQLLLIASMPDGSAPSLRLAAWFLFVMLGGALWPARQWWLNAQKKKL